MPSSSPDIEYTDAPSSELIDFLTSKINQETSEHGQASPFAFYIRDNHGSVVAGANGFLIYGTIYTDQLWVDASHRGHGLARNIMDKVHAFGQSKGCRFATIQTMSFQKAVHFYERLGYATDFTRAGYVNNSQCLFMRKPL